jgi:transposase-like protein
MSKERRRFSREFKVKIAEAYQSGVPAVELSRQFEIHPNVIYEWSREYRKDPVNAFDSTTNGRDAVDANDQRIAELERMVGRLATENEFLKKALTHAKSILLKDKPGSMKP